MIKRCSAFSPYQSLIPFYLLLAAALGFALAWLIHQTALKKRPGINLNEL